MAAPRRPQAFELQHKGVCRRDIEFIAHVCFIDEIGPGTSIVRNEHFHRTLRNNSISLLVMPTAVRITNLRRLYRREPENQVRSLMLLLVDL